MSEKQETSADIIAEMKRRKEMLEDAAFNAPLCYSTETMRAQCEILDEFVERLEAAHKREVDALEQRCAELNAEIAAKDEVIKRLNDAISEEQRRKMATTEKSSAVGDAAKLREALCDIVMLTMKVGYSIHGADACGIIASKAKRALSAPPRNCDVGTLEGQVERFAEFCHQHKHPESECLNCPLLFQTGGYCELAWAQTPYVEKEGGAK